MIIHAQFVTIPLKSKSNKKCVIFMTRKARHAQVTYEEKPKMKQTSRYLIYN